MLFPFQVENVSIIIPKLSFVDRITCRSMNMSKRVEISCVTLQKKQKRKWRRQPS